MKPWPLLKGGEPLFTAPKSGMIRTWVLNHTIDHRAQLGVYLRLNDTAVASIYGPSAEEGASENSGRRTAPGQGIYWTVLAAVRNSYC